MMVKLVEPLVERLLAGETFELLQNIGRQRFSTASGALSQRTVHGFRDIANLKRFGHA